MWTGGSLSLQPCVVHVSISRTLAADIVKWRCNPIFGERFLCVCVKISRPSYLWVLRASHFVQNSIFRNFGRPKVEAKAKGKSRGSSKRPKVEAKGQKSRLVQRRHNDKRGRSFVVTKFTEKSKFYVLYGTFVVKNQFFDSL